MFYPQRKSVCIVMLTEDIYIYIYISMCVCVCICWYKYIINNKSARYVNKNKNKKFTH